MNVCQEELRHHLNPHDQEFPADEQLCTQNRRVYLSYPLKSVLHCNLKVYCYQKSKLA